MQWRKTNWICIPLKQTTSTCVIIELSHRQLACTHNDHSQWGADRMSVCMCVSAWMWLKWWTDLTDSEIQRYSQIDNKLKKNTTTTRSLLRIILLMACALLSTNTYWNSINKLGNSLCVQCIHSKGNMLQCHIQDITYLYKAYILEFRGKEGFVTRQKNIKIQPITIEHHHHHGCYHHSVAHCHDSQIKCYHCKRQAPAITSFSMLVMDSTTNSLWLFTQKPRSLWTQTP